MKARREGVKPLTGTFFPEILFTPVSAVTKPILDSEKAYFHL
jgi:hypothetical protein